jgi:hypothetical protein
MLHISLSLLVRQYNMWYIPHTYPLFCIGRSRERVAIEAQRHRDLYLTTIGANTDHVSTRSSDVRPVYVVATPGGYSNPPPSYDSCVTDSVHHDHIDDRPKVTSV